jgi:hypothetical protein
VFGKKETVLKGSKRKFGGAKKAQLTDNIYRLSLADFGKLLIASAERSRGIRLRDSFFREWFYLT